MVLVIDNYDSFTYNLVQALGNLGAELRVFRNDALTLDDIEKLHPERLVVSPGPCTPKEAGISVAAIRRFAGRIPILGVCLGHQSIGEAFGAAVVRAPQPMHGKTSLIEHDGQGVYAGVPNPFVATRYHSLIVQPDTLPAFLKPVAYSQGDHVLMGVRHETWPLEGVQYHPESFLTTEGSKLLHNFLTGTFFAAVPPR